jgi:ferritin-like metal-binding protein YciE
VSLETLEDLFVHHLKDLYSAEKQLVQALPKMAKAANARGLRRAFEDHLKETQDQVQRLDRIFKSLDRGPRGLKCVGMEGLIEEGKELLKEDATPAVLDAGLISAAQRVEHYEMAAYGTARAWAELLGYQEAVDLLQETLDEEAAANEKLTALAERGVNANAAEPEEE